VLDSLESADGPAELLALGDVLARHLEGPGSLTVGAGRQADARDLE